MSNKENQQFSTKLPKSERLKSKLAIDELFAHGLPLKVFPLKFLYTINSEDSTDYPKLLVSVPKKKFKHAADRNLLKRRIKEAYRLHKHIIYQQSISSIGIIYVSNQKETFNIIEDKLILGFTRLKEKNK